MASVLACYSSTDSGSAGEAGGSTSVNLSHQTMSLNNISCLKYRIFTVQCIVSVEWSAAGAHVPLVCRTSYDRCACVIRLPCVHHGPRGRVSPRGAGGVARHEPRKALGYGAPTGAARDLVRFSEIQATALHSHTPLESKPKEHASAGFAIYNHHARHVLCRVESSEYAQTFTTYSTTCTCTTPQYTKAESIHPRN